ncbi:MAG: hypothetical protein WAL46_05765, partial [Nitrososphaeraceae archaeon]
MINSSDESEILKSLGDIFVHKQKLNENKSALLIFGSAEDSERITKILRSFGVHPLNIPLNMPQNPSAAYKEAQA